MATPHAAPNEIRRHPNGTLVRNEIKRLCFVHMAAAYTEASDNGSWPAVARQMAYALRRLTGLGDELKMNYVLKGANDTGLIDQYLTAHPDETAGWDVVRDVRGNYSTPGGREVSLGTIAVREEIRRIERHDPVLADDHDGQGFLLTYPKAGPSDDFAAVLYIEKEGFDIMLKRSGLLRRRDLAVASSKGFSVRACRRLLDFLANCDVPVLVAHDFDKAGLGIAGMILREIPDAIDIGLHLDDITDDRWGLASMSETVSYENNGKPYDPRPNLNDHDASDEEIAFLCSTAIPGVRFAGRRVELNALVGRMFLDWLEAKLDELHIGRLIPDDDLLAEAYRRAWRLGTVNKAIAAAWADARDAASELDVPDDLGTLVTNGLDDDPDRCWDAVIAALVTADLDDTDGES